LVCQPPSESVDDTTSWHWTGGAISAQQSVIGALAVIASAGCDQSVDAALWKAYGDNRPMTREDAYRKQRDLDVAAIIEGMVRVHGRRIVALMPEQ
jgi:hypothetical protein